MNKVEGLLCVAFKKGADITVDDDKSWVKVATEHEHPVKNKHIFQDSAERIATYFSSPKVSPKGLGQAVQKLNFYIQRGKHELAQTQIDKVKKAMAIIQKENKDRKVTVASAEQHHIFFRKTSEHPWQHHISVDDKEDVPEEKAYLRRSGDAKRATDVKSIKSCKSPQEHLKELNSR